MKVYKNSLSNVILFALEKTVDGYIRFEDFAQNPGFYAYSSARELNKSALAKALKRLRKGGLIDQVNVSNETIIKLTNTGRDMIQFEEDNEEWDGRWRLVIFDIPEQKRIVRNLFRRNLKKWGFKPLQKSVWISKRSIFDKLNKYVQELGLTEWVIVIESDKMTYKDI